MLRSTPAPEAWWRDRNVKGDEVAAGSGRAYISGAQVNAWDKPKNLSLHSGITSLGSLMTEISYFVWSACGSDFDTTGGMRNTSLQRAGVTNSTHCALGGAGANKSTAHTAHELVRIQNRAVVKIAETAELTCSRMCLQADQALSASCCCTTGSQSIPHPHGEVTISCTCMRCRACGCSSRKARRRRLLALVAPFHDTRCVRHAVFPPEPRPPCRVRMHQLDKRVVRASVVRT